MKETLLIVGLISWVIIVGIVGSQLLLPDHRFLYYIIAFLLLMPPTRFVKNRLYPRQDN